MSITPIDPKSIRKYITKLPMATKIHPVECNRYIINMVQKSFVIHPDIPKTTLWTYNGIEGPPLIEINRYCPIKVQWINKLPTTHLLERYIDHSIPGAGKDVPDVRTVVHLHGGEQSPSSDGDPVNWYTKNQYTISEYPNEQPSTFLFWHDHAMGITRLNAYAGLNGGGYIIRDKDERKLNLPNEKYEIPLVLTDRIFATDGSILFSDFQGNPPVWKPAFIGTIPLVNNGIWPYLKVKRNKYRFRIVNASDTRTYTLTFGGIKFVQIGSDGGFLPKPLTMTELTLAVAERADIIIDFKNIKPRTEIILQNTAKAPFPNGNAPDPETTGQLMKFVVRKKKGPHFCTRIPKKFKHLNPAKATISRPLLLSVDKAGSRNPDALFLNNSFFMNDVTERPLVGATEIWDFINLTNGMHPMHVHLIDFQLWYRQDFNTKTYEEALILKNPNFITAPGTGLLDPVPIDNFLTGKPIFPKGTNEDAWKDVIKCSPLQVTRIIVKFSPRETKKFPFDPTSGQYVWHCHIISHEDNEMMRPFRLYNELK